MARIQVTRCNVESFSVMIEFIKGKLFHNSYYMFLFVFCVCK